LKTAVLGILTIEVISVVARNYSGHAEPMFGALGVIVYYNLWCNLHVYEHGIELRINDRLLTKH